MLNMKITDALVAEHRVFCAVFDYIEHVLPNLSTQQEAKILAGLLESLLRGHGDAEENLAYVALDHVLDDKGRLDHMHHEHEEIDVRLKQAHAATDVADAQRLLKAVLQASREHFSYEERAVFPVIEEMLQPETLDELWSAWMRRRTAALVAPIVQSAKRRPTARVRNLA